MPIISKIGRKYPGVKGLYAGMYLLLIIGALTMIYPFLLMISGSMKSAVDIKNFDIIPAFLYNDTMLYRKHMEGLFNESLDQYNSTYDLDTTSFEQVYPPLHINQQLVAEWASFLQSNDVPSYAYDCGYIYTPVSKTIPLCLREFRHTLSERYHDNITAMNKGLGTDFVNWNSFLVLPYNYLLRINKPSTTRFAMAYETFKARQPEGLLYYSSAEGFYKKIFLKTKYSKDIDEYNRTHGTAYTSYADVHLTQYLPRDNPVEKTDWLDFVRNTLNLMWINIDENATSDYQQFLKAKYEQIDILNKNYDTTFSSFNEITMPEEAPGKGLPLSDWDAFISGWKDPDTEIIHIAPDASLKLNTLDFAFRSYLRSHYKSIKSLNQQLNTHYDSFLDILPPQRNAHYVAFLDLRPMLKKRICHSQLQSGLGLYGSTWTRHYQHHHLLLISGSICTYCESTCGLCIESISTTFKI